MGIELTNEQKKVVTFPERMLIIKGAAGSGKTLVGLHRAHHMVKDKGSSLFSKNKKVVFLTFNNSLINELRDKYRSYFGTEASEQIVFKTYDSFLYMMLKSSFLDEKPDHEISKFNEEWYKDRTHKNFIKSKLGDLNYNYTFIQDEFEYIILNNFSREEYMNVFRKNRKRRLLKSEREKIYEALMEYRERINRDEKIDGISMYNWFIENKLNPIIKDKDFDNVDTRCPELYEKFKDVHSIIIDESQDLSTNKIMIMLKVLDIFKHIKSLTFLYDVSQTLYRNTCFSGITSFKSIGIDGRKYVKSLNFSYRSTRQIHLCAYDMVSKFQDDNDKNEIALKPEFCQSDEGVKPFLIKFDNVEKEAEIFANTVETFLKEKKYDPLDMLVIPSEMDEMSIYREALENRGIKSAMISAEQCKEYNRRGESVRDAHSDSIRFCNTQTAKGMESRIIFMLGVNNICFKDEDRAVVKHYYVQMTRAMEYLFLSSVGEPNKFISSIDKKYLNEMEYEKDVDIIDLISDQTMVTNEHFKENRVKRFKDIAEKCKAEKEQETKADKVKEEKAVSQDAKFEKSDNEKDKMQSYIDYTDEKLEILPENVVRMLGMGLYYYKQGLDIDTAYFKLAKGIENVVREIYGEKGDGLGTMANALYFNNDYKKYIQGLYKKKIVRGRNKMAHEEVKNYKDLELIYDYVFREKQIVKFYQKYLDVQNKESEKASVEKIGEVFSKGAKIKVDGKEMFSHLIDGECYAVCDKLLEKGEYMMKGEYKYHKGQRMFIIKEYKKVKK